MIRTDGKAEIAECTGANAKEFYARSGTGQNARRDTAHTGWQIIRYGNRKVRT